MKRVPCRPRLRYCRHHAQAISVPVRSTNGIVASQNEIASRIGADAIHDGGMAVDAAVATAFALAVVHPTAGNLGGGGFLVYRPASGEPAAYDFREMAPGKSSPTMFLKDGKYSAQVHHNSYLSVGVPGTSRDCTSRGASRASCRGNGSSSRRSRSRAMASPSATASRDRAARCHGSTDLPGCRRAVSKDGVRTRPATRSSSPSSRGRSSGLQRRGRPVSTRERRRSTSRKRCSRTAG